MAKYVWRDEICSVCHSKKRICVRTDQPEDIICFSCTPAKPVEGMPSIRMAWKPTVSNITGFGKSYDDFDRDYDRMMREGA